MRRIVPDGGRGYRELARTIGDPVRCVAVGVEGTCSFGAGLTSYLAAEGFEVREVLRPKRDRRRRGSQRTTSCIARRMPEGKSRREAMRCPKRYVAREAYRALLAPARKRHADGPFLAARRNSLGLLKREVVGAIGVRVETASAIETERAEYFKARDAHEALPDRLEGPQNLD